jgi:hypothetical protein
MSSGKAVDVRDVFLSFGYVNEDLVTAVADRLEKKHSLRVFYSKWDIGGGDEIWTTISKYIDSCKVLTVFLSAAALGGAGVRKEISYALQKAYEEEKKNQGWKVIPVLLDPFDDISEVLPVEFRARKGIDFADHRPTFEDKVDDLARAIRGELPARTYLPARIPHDFYYCDYDHFSSVVLEVGSGLPSANEIGIRTKWSSPVTGSEWIRWDPQHSPQPHLGGVGGMIIDLAAHNWPGPARELTVHRAHLNVTPTSSLYLLFRYSGLRPVLESVALLDRHGRVIRQQLQRCSP